MRKTRSYPALMSIHPTDSRDSPQSRLVPHGTTFHSDTLFYSASKRSESLYPFLRCCSQRYEGSTLLGCCSPKLHLPFPRIRNSSTETGMNWMCVGMGCKRCWEKGSGKGRCWQHWH